MRDQNRGELVVPSRITVGQYLDDWLATVVKPRVRPQTLNGYQSKIHLYVIPALGSRRLDSIVPADLQHLYADMQAHGLSPRTVKHTHTILTSAFKNAVNTQQIYRNPVTAVSPPRQTPHEMHALSSEELDRFLAAAKDSRWNLLFTFAIATGMRPEEYFGLRWKDVDLDNSVVLVRKVLVRERKGGGWRLDDPKTPKSRRSVPIPEWLNEDLRAWQTRQGQQQLSVGDLWHHHDLVFPSSFGDPLYLSNFTARHFKPLLQRAGLPKTIRLYDLRHTSATLLLAANVHAKIVSERLGHSTINVTLDTYSHVLPTMQRGAAQTLGVVLSRDVGTP